jgi:hypothetical protein
MNKLEETLDLLEKVENYKDYKILLDKKVGELLQEYGFKRVKENFYAKGEEIFAKLYKNQKIEYCWAMPKILQEELDYVKVYKELKKTEMPSGLQFLEVSGVSIGTISLGGYCIHNFVLDANKDPQFFAYAMVGVAMFSLVLFGLGFNYLAKRNEKKFKENCEEIFYDKEALEKAFRG